ncbi:hypothetical protein BJV74DRAFT_772696 [Russula compacta]|nr:hypothetical protein BJV74DRAFT_772696 [Russula compacta]
MRFTPVTLVAIQVSVFLTPNAPFTDRHLLDCAVGCLNNITSSKCQAAQVSCLCEDTTFVSAETACFQSSCNGTDLQAAEKTARDSCAAAVYPFL